MRVNSLSFSCKVCQLIHICIAYTEYTAMQKVFHSHAVLLCSMATESSRDRGTIM